MLKILAKSVQFLSERLSVKRKMEAVNVLLEQAPGFNQIWS